MDLGGFVQRINVVAKNVEINSNAMMKRCALAVDQTVVLATPVRTGRARSNWRVSLGSPTTSEIEPYFPLDDRTDPSKFSEGQNAAAALAQGRATIQARKPEQTIYISNNVDYIGDLNRGASPQADPNFVQEAVRAGVDAVARSKVVT